MNNSNIVIRSLSNDPFKSLFLKFLESCDVSDIPTKTKAIQDFTRGLEELDSNSENESTFLHWSSIFSVFSSAGVISGFTVLNPFLGIVAGASAAASAIGVISLAIAQHQERKPILDKLRRYRIALASDEAINWACLWELTGTDIFLGSLYSASAGNLGDNRTLIRNDGKNPMAAALDSCRQYYGISRDELIENIRKLKVGVAVKPPSVTEELEQAPVIQKSEQATVLLPNPPTVLQPTGEDDNPFRNGVDILDGLVRNADKSRLGGCVILAAPGAGKTTFLGTAWGRLKKIYGTKFKSLAVIFKQSDLESFQGISDKAMCIQDSPIDAAIAVIKFISRGSKSDDCVKRLFLDDFLTLNQYMQMSLKGKYLNPRSMQVYFDKKSAIELEDYDAIPFIDVFYSSLNQAWLIGREYNLGLWVSSHSSNVDALPFVGSRESRSVGDLIFLAKTDKREFIEQALNNPNLIGDNLRRQQLKQAFSSQHASETEPLVLANFNNWTLGIVPNEIYEEYQAYRSMWRSADDPVISSLDDDDRETLETLFKKEVKSKSIPDLDKDEEPAYSYIAQVVLEVIKAEKPPISFESIRKSRRWDGSKPKTDELRLAISELISKEVVEGDDESG